ncbi:O-antigen ligase family protein [Formosa sp. Hel3_A1_48]|uniref:O-antigen ligase family protein n=1 Tax=Formosa sp. Hel3_A1_48 TaxID=1336795 RepID=UPI0012FA1930|nr:O-antigen ligase family protein [Formosa sp. Hel3_A1_48]
MIVFLTNKRSFKSNVEVNYFYFIIFLLSTLSFLFNYAFDHIADFMLVQYGNLLRLILVLIVFNYSKILLKDYLLGIRIGVVLGAISIIISSYLKLDLVLLSNDLTSDYQTRFSGFYLNANYGGIIIALAYNLFHQKKYKITLIETIILFLSVFYTFSFTAILILLIGFYRNNRILFILTPVFSSLYLITFWDSFNFNLSRYKKLKYLNDYFAGNAEFNSLFTGRIDLWTEGFTAIADRPFTGNGFGFMASSIKTINDVGIHNSYFEIFGDFGIIIGLLLISALFYVMMPNKLVGLSLSIALITGHGLLYSIPFFLLLTLNNSDNKINN